MTIDVPNPLISKTEVCGSTSDGKIASLPLSVEIRAYKAARFRLAWPDAGLAGAAGAGLAVLGWVVEMAACAATVRWLAIRVPFPLDMEL